MNPWSVMVLMLFALNLGVAFGAGVYEHRIAVPRWLSHDGPGRPHWHAEAAKADDTGRRFWGFASTLPLTLLTIASLVLATRTAGPVRPWWLAAGILALADRGWTFTYFIPTLLRLMASADSPEAAALASRWSAWNHGRHVLTLSAALLSLRALSLVHFVPGMKD
jgi:hypothetical protein